MLVHVYRGEGRLLIIPITHCCEAEWFVNLQLPEKSIDVGRAILDARDYIMYSDDEIKVYSVDSPYRAVGKLPVELVVTDLSKGFTPFT